MAAMKRAALLIVLAQLAAGAALAQEYGRASGGQLQLFTKQPSNFSGSLGFTLSRSLFGDNLKGYEGSLGGTLVPDRMWFFGSMQRNDVMNFTPSSSPLFGKFSAQLGEKQTIDASNFTALPASFRSLHYTGIISPNSFFSATVSQSATHP